jgi:hypothetical protein
MQNSTPTYVIPETFTGFLKPYPLRVLTRTDQEMMFHVIRAISNGMPETKWKELHDHIMDDGAYAILYKRIRFHGVNVAIPPLTILADMCANPAHCVVMAWTMSKLQASLKVTEIGMDHLFGPGAPYANGFPDVTNKAAFDKVWESQKSGGANLLDVAPWPTSRVTCGPVRP